MDGKGDHMKAKRRVGRKPKEQPVTLPKVSIVEIDTKNPYFNEAYRDSADNPRVIKAQFNMRESYVGMIYAQGAIDDAEKWAADQIRRHYEALGASGASAMDYTREFVDGGQIAQSITDAQLVSSRVLKEAYTVLGPAGFDLTIRLAGDGVFVNEMSANEGMRRYLSIRFRECLETLAVHWGKKNRSIRSFTA